jgi:hypothetical protein
VVVVVDADTGKLSVCAFTMDQRNVLPPAGIVLAPGMPFSPGPFAVDQLTIVELSAMTGLDFGDLARFDSLAAQSVPAALRPPGPLRLPLTSAREAVLWAPP